jgi:hypothetical protein
MDWQNAILSLVIGLGGGVVGAFVSNHFQVRRDRLSRRSQAKNALMTYERALSDKADSMYESLGFNDGWPSFARATWDDIRAARNEAYLWKEYLQPGDRHLVTTTQIADDGVFDDNSSSSAESLAKRSSDLTEAIERSFRPDASAEEPPPKIRLRDAKR